MAKEWSGVDPSYELTKHQEREREVIQGETFILCMSVL